MCLEKSNQDPVVGQGCGNALLCKYVQGSAKRWALGCVNLPPSARRSQEEGFKQPRAHLLANPCMCLQITDIDNHSCNTAALPFCPFLTLADAFELCFRQPSMMMSIWELSLKRSPSRPWTIVPSPHLHRLQTQTHLPADSLDKKQKRRSHQITLCMPAVYASCRHSDGWRMAVN